MLDNLVRSIVQGGANAVTGNNSTEGAQETQGAGNAQQVIGGILGLVKQALPIVGAILGGF